MRFLFFFLVTRNYPLFLPPEEKRGLQLKPNQKMMTKREREQKKEYRLFSIVLENL